MQSRYGAARLLERAENPGVWRVIVGAGGSQEAAETLARRIHAETGENNGFVVRLN
jgi:hypothetical protein